jgi:hypothetical protein
MLLEGTHMPPMSRVGLAVRALVLAVASCSPAASQPEEPTTDAGCVASPTAGAACEPGILACTVDLPCQPSWTCDAASHSWSESGPNCNERLPDCETPTPGGLCDPGIPACLETPEAGCSPVVTWTCDGATQRWDESIADAGCDAQGG